MRVLSIKVPIRKKSGNLFNDLRSPLLPERTHASCVSPQVYFLFCKHCKILRKPNDLVGNLHIEFASSYLPSGSGLFTAFGTCVVLYRLPCGIHIFGIWSTSGALERTARLSITDLHLLGSKGLIKSQDVSVGLDSFFAFSNGDSNICDSVFPGLIFISSSVAYANSLLQILPLEVLSCSCG